MSDRQVVTAQGLPNVGDWRGKEREGEKAEARAPADVSGD